MVVAAATPPGRGALAVVRLTGSGVMVIVDRLVVPATPGPIPIRRPRRVELIDEGVVYDDGLIVRFAAPSSATGEDLVEITCHGNPRIVDRLVGCAVRAGARHAQAGEFTRRAWLNGRLDLVEAESVLQIALAESDAGVRIARAGLDGRLHTAIAAVREPLVAIAADLEARLDYPADELAYLDDAELIARLRAAAAASRALAATEDAGRALVNGARVALVGAVNAGKSSLFNALLGRPRALVHDTPGTTRDVLEVVAELDGLRVTWLDTAGERVTADPIEAAGLALARDLTGEADLLVVVLRGGSDHPDAIEQQILARTADRRRIVVYNGADRGGTAPIGSIPTVAVTGAGVDAVRRAVRDALIGGPTVGDVLRIASARQAGHLRDAGDAADEAVDVLDTAGVAVAADAVRRALRALDAIGGGDGDQDVMNALFARFCIGK